MKFCYHFFYGKHGENVCHLLKGTVMQLYTSVIVCKKMSLYNLFTRACHNHTMACNALYMCTGNYTLKLKM